MAADFLEQLIGKFDQEPTKPSLYLPYSKYELDSQVSMTEQVAHTVRAASGFIGLYQAYRENNAVHCLPRICSMLLKANMPVCAAW